MVYKKEVTLHDLAAQLQLSVHTVSKALRGLPGMSEETRRAVVELARKSGYRTKEQERGLAAESIPLYPAKTRTFLFMMTGSMRHSAMHQQILQGLQEKMGEFGHNVKALVVPTEAEPGQFADWLEQHNVAFMDGVFIPPAIDERLERLLLGTPLPRIMINFPPSCEEVDSVIWDVGTAIKQSVRYLLANGHRSILYIGETTKFRGFRLRWRAFKEAMAEAGLDVDPEQHVTGNAVSREAWVTEVAGKLQRMNATAVLGAVVNDMAWIYYACMTIGRSIPHDCSLIGLLDERNELLPNLSRPVLLVRETGIRAAERMLWRIANPSQPYEHTLLQGPFFPGETVLPVAKSGRRNNG